MSGHARVAGHLHIAGRVSDGGLDVVTHGAAGSAGGAVKLKLARPWASVVVNALSDRAEAGRRLRLEAVVWIRETVVARNVAADEGRVA